MISCLSVASLRGESPAENDVMMRALADELSRGMNHLVLEELGRPYFIQYRAEERFTHNLAAADGALIRGDEDRSRGVASRVRVGSPALDNTNIIGSGGFRGGALPLEDDYGALRQSLWLITDRDYKAAVETFTRKEAFLREKTVEDRPDDFSPTTPVQALEPAAEIAFPRDVWRNNIIQLSARLKQFPRIQDSQVSFFAGAVNGWIVNSEGTRLRTAETGVFLEVEAELQAPEGMRLTNELLYLGERIDQLPPFEKMQTDVDTLCSDLIRLTEAPVLEQYTGPVLFDAPAAGKAFYALLAEGVAARPVPLGAGSQTDDSLEKKIGLRILPKTFIVYDDPTPSMFENVVLAGSYQFDDEAVAPLRVSIVEKGILKNLVAGRSPSKKVKGSTGHGRSFGLGDPQATIGCLYVEDQAGVSAEELKQELIQSARDEGLEFGLRIASLQQAVQGSLGNPIFAYKVYVADGREELIRGMKFLSVQTRALKRILAAGKERRVYNKVDGVASSIIAPAILFEELELTKIEEEFDKLPILKAPALRASQTP